MFVIWWSIRGVHQGTKVFDTATAACNWIDAEEEAIDGFEVDHIFQKVAIN